MSITQVIPLCTQIQLQWRTEMAGIDKIETNSVLQTIQFHIFDRSQVLHRIWKKATFILRNSTSCPRACRFNAMQNENEFYLRETHYNVRNRAFMNINRGWNDQQIQNLYIQLAKIKKFPCNCFYFSSLVENIFMAWTLQNAFDTDSSESLCIFFPRDFNILVSNVSFIRWNQSNEILLIEKILSVVCAILMQEMRECNRNRHLDLGRII